MTVKKTLLFAICILKLFNVEAQEQKRKLAYAITYNETAIGQNINLLGIYEVRDKWRVYLGPKYHINSLWYKSDIVPYKNKTSNEYAYFSKINATKILDHFGLKLGFERVVLTNNSNSEILLFYDFQVYSIQPEYEGGGIDPNGQTFLFTPWPGGKYTGNDNYIETYLGCTLQALSFKEFYVKIQAAAGAYKSTQMDGLYYINVFPAKWSFGGMVGLGIEYRPTKK
ncbi:MAG: hypothetical protein H3C54_02855 [Taibaiella sp.]|nr:hypothetical protein [Taibaiella sp.]